MYYLDLRNCLSEDNGVEQGCQVPIRANELSSHGIKQVLKALQELLEKFMLVLQPFFKVACTSLHLPL